MTCQLLAGDGGDEADLLLTTNISSTISSPVLPSPPSPGSSPATPPPLPSPHVQTFAHQGSSSTTTSSSSSSSLRVAGTRLPSSYRPSKGEVSWDQRLDVATVRLDKLLAPGLGRQVGGPVRLRLRIGLWASASSTLLGQVEAPLLLVAGDEAPVLQLGVQRLPILFFHRPPLDRRGSAVEASSYQHSHTPSSRKGQLPPRWRRAASEPVGKEAAAGAGTAAATVALSRLQLDGSDDEEAGPIPQSSPSLRPFAWPVRGQLTIDIALLSTQGADEQKEEAEAEAMAGGAVYADTDSPLVLVHALLTRPSDLLSKEEAAVLWAHRQGLAQERDGRALVKLLRAALAYGPSLAEGSVEVGGLLEMWTVAGGALTTLDAMKLLGRCVICGVLAETMPCPLRSHTFLSPPTTQALPRPAHPRLRPRASGAGGGRRGPVLPPPARAATALRVLGRRWQQQQRRRRRGGAVVAAHEHAPARALPRRPRLPLRRAGQRPLLGPGRRDADRPGAGVSGDTHLTKCPPNNDHIAFDMNLHPPKKQHTKQSDLRGCALRLPLHAAGAGRAGLRGALRAGSLA